MIRSLLLSILLSVGLAPAAVADKIPLGDLSGYLNSFETASGEFTQINSDGTLSTGQVYIRRPGRIRFEYNPPDKSLVMAGGGRVAVFDGKSNTSPEEFPLRKTPLNLILQKNVDLSRARMVVGHGVDGQKTVVVAQDPEHPEYGNIRLIFTDQPVELRQWVITDSSGEQTTVVLGKLSTNVALPGNLFSIPQERAKYER